MLKKDKFKKKTKLFPINIVTFYNLDKFSFCLVTFKYFFF